MYCHRCGKEIEDGSEFCCYCGTKMPEVEANPLPLALDNHICPNINEHNNENTDLRKKRKHRKYMNSSLATVITFFVDFLALLLGSALIAFIGVGGILVMLIEFYFLKAIHKTIYKALTGKKWGTKTEKKEKSFSQSKDNSEEKETNSESLNHEQVDKVESFPIKIISSSFGEENEDIGADSCTSPSKNGFIIIKKEETQPIVSRQSKPSLSLYHDKNNNEKQSWNKSNFFTSVFPKIIHDVNINFGKSTVFCILAILISIIICVCVVTCNNSTHTDVISDEGEITTPPSYENEEERWDAENCIYANFKYGIAFNLPKDMAWHKISGTAKHTVVKFVQPETQLTIFVNINPIEKMNPDKYTEDIWDVYEEFVKLLLSIIQQKVNENSAEKVTDYHYRKAEICGKHAIKTFYKSEYSDDRYQDKTPLTTIDYTFLYNHCITTVTIKCFDDVMDFLQEKGITMEDLLKCFQLTPISEKYIRAHENTKCFRMIQMNERLFNMQNKHTKHYCLT